MHDVAIVLVGLNARDYVRGCLQSIYSAEWRNICYEIVYVDNASTDGTPEMVQREFPEVRLLTNSTNLGYCRAANQGAREASSRNYYFINDDTLVIYDAIALLVEFVDDNPGIGTVGSRLLYPDGSEQWSGRRFPSLMNAAIFGRRSPITRLLPNSRFVRSYLCKNELEKGQPFEVDWVSAAGQIVRRETFWEVGGYAEDYYYWHEAVFCDRIRRAGKSVLLHPQSKIVHYEGKGSGARPLNVQRFHIKDFHRGAYRCYCEHHRLRKWHPRRGLALLALNTRAGILLVLAHSKARASSTPTGNP